MSVQTYVILKLTKVGGLIMYKAYVFRMYPNDKQKQIINQNIGNSKNRRL